MDNLLKKLYNDPKTGFIGSDKLYKKAKAIDQNITLKRVKEWYSRQEDTQRYSNQNKKYLNLKLHQIIRTNGR